MHYYWLKIRNLRTQILFANYKATESQLGKPAPDASRTAQLGRRGLFIPQIPYLGKCHLFRPAPDRQTVRRLPDRPDLRRNTGFIRHSKRLPNQRPVCRNRHDNNRHPNQRNHNDPPRRLTEGQGFYPEINQPFP
jgi:hypothetical protein